MALTRREMTITCNGRSQTCTPIMFYEKVDGAAALYQFDNQWPTLYGHLPSNILRLIPSAYALPKRFVVKTRPLDDNDARLLIQTEKKAYGQMQRLQGNIIPRVWSDVVVKDLEESSFAMELLQGDSLFNLSTPDNPFRPQLDVDFICFGICRCFRAISKYNVVHLDVDDLANIMLAQQPLQPSVFLEAICFAVLFLSRGNHFLAMPFLALWMTSLLNSWWACCSRVVLIDWENFYNGNDEVLQVNQNTARFLSNLFRERYFSVQTDIPLFD